MTTQVTSKKATKVDVGQESGKFMVRAITVLAAMIGIWGMACLIGGLANIGISGLVQGFITALTGV